MATLFVHLYVNVVDRSFWSAQNLHVECHFGSNEMFNFKCTCFEGLDNVVQQEKLQIYIYMFFGSTVKTKCVV